MKLFGLLKRNKWVFWSREGIALAHQSIHLALLHPSSRSHIILQFVWLDSIVPDTANVYYTFLKTKTRATTTTKWRNSCLHKNRTTTNCNRNESLTWHTHTNTHTNLTWTKNSGFKRKQHLCQHVLDNTFFDNGFFQFDQRLNKKQLIKETRTKPMCVLLLCYKLKIWMFFLQIVNYSHFFAVLFDVCVLWNFQSSLQCSTDLKWK